MYNKHVSVRVRVCPRLVDLLSHLYLTLFNEMEGGDTNEPSGRLVVDPPWLGVIEDTFCYQRPPPLVWTFFFDWLAMPFSDLAEGLPTNLLVR